MNLTIVSEYKYLGVILDDHLKYTVCSKTLADSGGRALSAVVSKFKQFKDIGYGCYTKMFDACVAPVLDYGSGIWGKAKVNHSDIIQNKAYRYFLGVHNFTPVAAMQADMGWLPCKQRKYLKMLRFWNRLINMQDDRLTKQIFNVQYQHETPNSWCTNVKDIFSILGKVNMYNQKLPCNLKEIEDLLYENAEKEWKEVVEKKPKLRTFKTFKRDCKTSDYVKWTINRFDRSLFAKFRSGILQLRVESGRFNNIKLEDRICELCDDQKIEDEFHFLCVCQKYSDLRTTLFNSVSSKHEQFTNMNLNDRFKFLIINCAKDVIKFLKNAWDLRKHTLFN